MNQRNLQHGGYGRVNGDTIKVTNSMIFPGQQKVSNTNFTLKHAKEPEPQPRTNMIPRYASEEELKKIPINPTTPK